MSATELVFDNQDLKKLILTKVIKMKYDEEVKEGIKTMVNEEISKNWWKYCSCPKCIQTARRMFNDDFL